MSYEGYSRFLCKNGHLWTEDDLMQMWSKDSLEDNKCPKCGGSAVWENIVNLTNGSYDDEGERIDGFIELEIKSEWSGICSECGGKHICETIYKIPKDLKND